MSDQPRMWHVPIGGNADDAVKSVKFSQKQINEGYEQVGRFTSHRDEAQAELASIEAAIYSLRARS